MTLATFYLVLSIVSLLTTSAAIFRARRLYYFVPVYFLLGWIGGELAIQRLLMQLLITLFFVGLGGLDSSAGHWGLAIFLLSWVGCVYLHLQSMGSAQVLKKALITGLGQNYRQAISTERQSLLADHVPVKDWMRPFSMKRSGVERIKNISYGDAGERNLLDIYKPTAERVGGYPILIQVHGGAWMIGNKQQQALPLMYHLAQRGWICVSINYRLSPKAKLPAHIIDVKKAISWVREYIADYGGNTDFVAITGGSAGGHLSSLAALTPNNPIFQPGFEQANTSVDAAVPFYGVYDFTDRHEILGDMSIDKFLAEPVFGCSLEQDKKLWDLVSSESHVNKEAPPFFVIQGSHDSLVHEETATAFVKALRAVSNQPVAYAVIAGAQHAFDIFHCLRADNTVLAATDFLEWSYADKMAEKKIK